ncbi:uncharacterized protein BCR38DRAFT_459697 [Pseudomassariella vexata]|uniref:Endoplasmic reticulum junction formation protein lunapark n=1 Tax=Pseudomassariella vexata TaxID=1141098 RepID=A0A1Y2DNG5_9PEZI|nr:uncharacterized protein BCR38DRAFT_459697 [Pseudomassariella vexata]ORY60676.1 hypothetical protein BCR38DRAFT_459697 [Pseudomassariella vexata]
MVSFWPWGSNDSSPASFEKTLSTLSKKIAATQLQLDKVRSNSRRVKVLWTLYLSFVYLVYAIVLMLVVGWQNLGPWEWTGTAGGPVLIYLIRTITATYFTTRIDSLESRLKDQHSERAATIQKLKDATRYDSTQELLEKYGGEKPKGKKKMSHDDDDSSHENKDRKGSQQNAGPGASPGGRTNLPPPPTANIQRPGSAAGTPHNQHQQQHPHYGPFSPPPHKAPSPSPSHQYSTAEFAPNASKELPASYAQFDYTPGPPRWYDRVLDLMLGEDETAPKNRIVLICGKCRLVNGQAPPGTRCLADMGRWKCMSCGAMNGEMDEGQKIVREVLGDARSDGAGERNSEGSNYAVNVERPSNEDEDGFGSEDEAVPVVEESKLKQQAGRLGSNKSQMFF